MALLIILWVLFFFLHSMLASNRAKRIAEKQLGKQFRFYRMAYNIFSFIFLTGILLLLFSDRQDHVFIPSRLSNCIGSVLIGSGLIIMLLAFKNYDLVEFSGISQLAQKIHHPEKLSVTGLNRYVRNPLYSGIIVLAAGYFLRLPTYMNLATIIILYLYIYIGTRLEEKKLEEVFGEEYREYKRKVKMLIPFLF